MGHEQGPEASAGLGADLKHYGLVAVLALLPSVLILWPIFLATDDVSVPSLRQFPLLGLPIILTPWGPSVADAVARRRSRARLFGTALSVSVLLGIAQSLTWIVLRGLAAYGIDTSNGTWAKLGLASVFNGLLVGLIIVVTGFVHFRDPRDAFAWARELAMTLVMWLLRRVPFLNVYQQYFSSIQGPAWFVMSMLVLSLPVAMVVWLPVRDQNLLVFLLSIVMVLVLAIPLGVVTGFILAWVIDDSLSRFSQIWPDFRDLLVRPLITFAIGYFAIILCFATWFSMVNSVEGGVAFCARPAVGQTAAPGALASVCPGSPDYPTFGDFLFLSTTTFSTVGYGFSTVTPRTPLSQTLVAVEPVAAFGWTVVVIGVLLTRLLG